jgi:hypothetical protein
LFGFKPAFSLDTGISPSISNSSMSAYASQNILIFGCIFIAKIIEITKCDLSSS